VAPLASPDKANRIARGRIKLKALKVSGTSSVSLLLLTCCDGVGEGSGEQVDRRRPRGPPRRRFRRFRRGPPRKSEEEVGK